MEESNQRKEILFYKVLSQTLSKGNLNLSAELVENSFKLDIHVNPQNIPDLTSIISNLLIECIQNLDLGRIFEILRFFNEYNLFKRRISIKENKLISKCQVDPILMKNLEDLFGKTSPSFLAYLRFEMPKNLYQYYQQSPYFSEEEYGIEIITNFLDRYVIYGLSIENLGNSNYFLKKIENQFSSSNYSLERVIFHRKTHLVCPAILLKMKDSILSSDYKFYNLSMIILRGIGPQGLGFSYSTPKGEIIEICSDRKENEAIIIKFKQFIKKKFVKELESQLLHYSIDQDTARSITEHLLEILNDYTLIGYFEQETILQDIMNFIKEQKQSDELFSINLTSLIKKVENSLLNVLRPIEIVDQFKTRIDLVITNKLGLEDVAKLTSLKDKSHYDILRERVFFQYIIKWFKELYIEKSKMKKI